VGGYVEWKGTEEELKQLSVVLGANCRRHDNQPCDEACAHRLMGNQKSMDRLLFGRRLSARFWTEEMRSVGDAAKEVCDP
jgi:hypothetical protein